MVNNGVWVTRCHVRKFAPHGVGIMIGQRAGGLMIGQRAGSLMIGQRAGGLMIGQRAGGQDSASVAGECRVSRSGWEHHECARSQFQFA